MNKVFHLKSIWLIAFLIFWSAKIWGATGELPCLVFTGPSEQKSSHDIETYNRIYLGDEGFTLHSNTYSDFPDIELLYSLFNHLEFKDDVPSAGVELNLSDGESFLRYSEIEKILEISTPSTNNFSLGIFNLSGMLIAASDLGSARKISVDALSSGVYVAVATDGIIKLTVKFIVK